MVVFVTDARNNIGHPTRRSGWINKKLKEGTAKKLKRYGNVIQVQILDHIFNKSETIDCEFRIGIDPGYQHIGFCLYKIFNKKITKLLSGEVLTRTEEIKKLLQERKMYRQARRRYRRENFKRKYGFRKFRHPIWKNRRDKLDWNPTLRHLIDTHCNLLIKLTNLISLDQTKYMLSMLRLIYIGSSILVYIPSGINSVRNIKNKIISFMLRSEIIIPVRFVVQEI